jgi:peroxiredoxin Q/BCP
MLKTGTRAPDFTLPNQDDQSVSLRSLSGKGPFIIYFYPADFTPGCTKEACSIRDLHQEIQGVGLRIVGVSPQSTESHRRFRDKHGLPFDLLSDPDKVAIKAYDLDGPLGFGVRRGTYLVDGKGVIQGGVLADLRIAEHETFIRKAIELSNASAKR